jgi:hypothetical protein
MKKPNGISRNQLKKVPNDELFDIDKEARIYYPDQTARFNKYDPKYKVSPMVTGDRRIPNSDKLRNHRSLKY